FERVFEVLDLKPNLQESDNPIAIPEGKVDVEFDNVTFSYPTASEISLPSLEEGVDFVDRGGEELLHNVSFTIEAGTMTALVGSSGAGKSTISQLVPRLYDIDSGSVKIGGVDVRDV